MNAIAIPAKDSIGQNGMDFQGALNAGVAECAVVAMESFTVEIPLPAGIVAAGEKEAVAPAGKPETTENVTALMVVEFTGVTIRSKLAGLPAVTELAGAGTLTTKSSTTIVSAGDVPPPGAGLLTARFNVPL